jgi:hypothetical protein
MSKKTPDFLPVQPESQGVVLVPEDIVITNIRHQCDGGEMREGSPVGCPRCARAGRVGSAESRETRLRAINAELLEALEDLLGYVNDVGVRQRIEAAIAKAEGES